MKDGFIQVPRAFFYTDEWKEKRRFTKAEAMIDLMKEATFKQRTVQCGGYEIVLNPGELVASKRFFAKRWDWPPTTVGTFLRKLESIGFATIGPPRTTTSSDHLLGPPPNVLKIIIYRSSATSAEQNQITLIDHNAKPPAATKTEERVMKKKEYTPAFLKFWEAYPRKVAKAAAFKAWISNGCEEIAKAIVKSVHDHAQHAWRDPKFIPHPPTFLNGHRWEDELRTKPSKQTMTEQEQQDYYLKGVNK